MTLNDAIKKADRIAQEHGAAVVVAVADPAHGNGEGDNRFDACTQEYAEYDARNEKYLTVIEQERTVAA